MHICTYVISIYEIFAYCYICTDNLSTNNKQMLYTFSVYCGCKSFKFEQYILIQHPVLIVTPTYLILRINKNKLLKHNKGLVVKITIMITCRTFSIRYHVGCIIFISIIYFTNSKRYSLVAIVNIR